ELVVERGVDRSRCADLEQRIAVRRCLHDRLRADIAGGPRPVLDDEWSAEPFRQPLSPQPRENVAAATGGGGSRLSPAPDATDRLAPMRRATRPAARQRPLTDGENFGGEVSF